jgi:hypothetical protein
MDFRFTQKEETLKKEIAEFAKKELPPDWFMVELGEFHSDEQWPFVMSISKKLAERGWLAMSFPKEYGGQGASVAERMVYCEEAGYWMIPGTTMGISGVGWNGPSLIRMGNEEQKRKYLPLIASGEPDGVWCTIYSEIEAGSDFANIKTTAIREGEEYIINGKKVSISAAHRARWGWLAAKTNPSVAKKHHGISIIIVDMKSPGITVVPTPSFGGIHINSDVIFDNVHVPVSNLVGEENKGWYQLMTSLTLERGSLIAAMAGGCRREVAELVKYANETQYDGEPLSQNPIVRQKLAERAIEVEALRLLAYRTAWIEAKGGIPTYQAPMDKAYGDEIRECLHITTMQILGAYSQLESGSKWCKLKGMMETYVNAPGLKFGMGTTEIQKLIVGQFGLGLPRSY